MKKFSLLEQLRAERERHEAEITAPLRDAMDHLRQRVHSLESRLRAVEKALGSEIASLVVERISAGVAVELRQKIMEAAAKAAGSREPVTLTIDQDILRFMDPRSLEREILDRYASRALPTLRLDAEFDPAKAVTVVDIHIPALGYRHAMADLH